MTFEYTLIVKVNLSSINSEIKKVVDEINDFIGKMGFDEKMVIMSGLPITLTSSKELTAEEKELICEEMQFNANKQLGKGNVIIEGIF